LADKTLFFCVFMGKNSLEVVLVELMATVQITSWQQLSNQTGISTKRLRKLRQGQREQLKLSELHQLSQSFQISLVALLERLGISGMQSYQEEPTVSPQEFQLRSIQTIESFLTYWPAAAHQAQSNPNFPASKLLPLVKPIERLLAHWNVVQVQAVGTTWPFNPQQHQEITAGISGVSSGQIQAGEMVTIRYPGYQQGDKLLWRAQVSRV
jgi:DNA-binding Xre family transcriptional regulator